MHLNEPRIRNRRKFRVDPNFELKLDDLGTAAREISAPSSPRSPTASPRSHFVFDPNKSKLTQKFSFDDPGYPEDLIAMHIYGFDRAYKRYCDKVTAIYEKNCDDDDRLWRSKSVRLKRPTDPIQSRKRTDFHIVERVIQESKKASRANASSARTPRVERSLQLPTTRRLSNEITSPRTPSFT